MINDTILKRQTLGQNGNQIKSLASPRVYKGHILCRTRLPHKYGDNITPVAAGTVLIIVVIVDVVVFVFAKMLKQRALNIKVVWPSLQKIEIRITVQKHDIVFNKDVIHTTDRKPSRSPRIQIRMNSAREPGSCGSVLIHQYVLIHIQSRVSPPSLQASVVLPFQRHA